jgi:pimeloyl-ACP methyl ester carboxylesterase
MSDYLTKLLQILFTVIGVIVLLRGPVNANRLVVRQIVLVHGAWVDGSGWRPVYDILVRDGFKVTIVQEPLTSFAADVVATRRVLDRESGPCILVGHSYGGSVITEAGTNPNVVCLVYIAAHMPDSGENQASVATRFPSALARAKATEVVDGYSIVKPAAFHKYFAADLPQDIAAFEADAQIWSAVGSFSGTITTAAWRSKPTWVMSPTADMVINPKLERWYAARAHSHVVQVAGASHSVYESQPRRVAGLIEEAASHALDGR